jgi:hypothetical protein
METVIIDEASQVGRQQAGPSFSLVGLACYTAQAVMNQAAGLSHHSVDISSVKWAPENGHPIAVMHNTNRAVMALSHRAALYSRL